MISIPERTPETGLVAHMLLLVGLMVLWLPQPALASPVVLVLPLEATSHQLGRYADVARARIEDSLINSGDARVVERARMDAMVSELGFSNYSGLADLSSATRFGQMLGANFLVQGTLLDANHNIQTFRSYGINSSIQTTEASLRIRVIELASGQVTFSRIVSGRSSRRVSDSGAQGAVDAVGTAVDDAVRTFVGQDEFHRLFRDQTAASRSRQIAIPVHCMNDPCDVEVDGLFFGSTPTELILDEGVIVEVLISKPGFEPWVRRLQPRDGLRIDAELAARH